MSKLNQEELIGILRRAGKLPGLRGWHGETVEQIVALIKKPQVTEEWIYERMGELFKKHTIGFPTPKAIEIFTELLKEAGISVA